MTTGPDDPTIGSRSASSNPAIAAWCRPSWSRLRPGDRSGGQAPPVTDRSRRDSHVELPVQEATLDELSRRDLPFRTAVGAGVPAVMVGHIDVRAIDPGVPSSLSAPVVDLLRDELGFDGLVVTDAMDMAPSRAVSGPARRRSGPSPRRRPRADASGRACGPHGIVDAVAEGRLPAARWPRRPHRRGADAARGRRRPATTARRGRIPRRGVVRGVPGRVDRPVRAVRRPWSVRRSRSPVEPADRALLPRRRRRPGWRPARATSFDCWRVPGPGSGDVVVALDTPYGLGESSATSGIALYGRTPAAFRALVDVLTGTASGGGTLPVEVPGADRRGCTLAP